MISTFWTEFRYPNIQSETMKIHFKKNFQTNSTNIKNNVNEIDN